MAIRRLRWVLTLQPLVAIILPFGVAVLLGVLWIQPQIKSEIETRQRQLARAVGMQVEGHLQMGAALVRAAAVVNPDHILPHHEHQRQLDALLETTDIISSLYVVGADGRVTEVSLKNREKKHWDDLIGLDLSANPLFRELSQDGKPRWSKTFLSVIHGGLVAAYGMRNGDTTLIGEVDLSFLTKFIQQISTESDLLILTIDQNGQIVADNNGLYTAQQLNIGNIGLVRAGLETKTPATGRFPFAGRAMTGSIIPIPSVNWHILVAKTNSSLYRTVSDIGVLVLAAAMFALAVGILTSIFIARKLASRFSDLSRHAQNIAQGGRSGHWPRSSIDAFSQLSDSLQLMARRLQDSETLYRSLFEQLPDGVVLWELSSLTPMQFNSAAHTQLGYTRDEFAELTIEDFRVFSSDASIAEQQETLRREGSASYEAAYRTKTGETRSMIITLQSIELAAQPMVLALRRDITPWKIAEEKRLNLEKQMLHGQKLESLGLLAGGIAHDFNNILLTITGNTDMAIRRIGNGASPVEHLQRIKQAAGKAADLAQQMLAYSGKGKFLVESLDLNQMLEEMLHMLQVSISKDVSLQLNLSRSLPAIEADATQIHQVIMNLVLNAAEAIGDKSGMITITTNAITCNKGDLRNLWREEGFSEGEYVYLEIADTGCGMSQETLAKLFDPFFTTKFTGRGLGMSAVQGIVRSHHGAIDVASEPGRGSTFKVLLPASDKLIEAPGSKAPQKDWNGGGTILLVDDEEAVRDIGTELLMELGFSVITACDGRAALDTYSSAPNIDLVIVDLTMPQLDGERCFRELRQINPDIKVILSSGYSELSDAQKLMEQGLVGFIQKPYGLETLRETIQKALQ